MSRGQICAQCEHFKFRDADEKPYPQLAHGIGRCAGFDGHVAPVEPYVRWDAPYCVNFGRAKDMEKRMQWIAMRKRVEEEGANAAAAGAQPQGDANESDRLRSHAPIETNAATRLLA